MWNEAGTVQNELYPLHSKLQAVILSKTELHIFLSDVYARRLD